ncbi:MAG: glycosyltransferase [Lentimicrobiaceae bacterium]|nr:glycosyltransferase [Lentimicrobiaceae bacterium]
MYKLSEVISVCIPIYNFDVTPLVETLLNQINDLSCICEIVLIDDFSDEKFRAVNRKLKDKVHYIELKKNMGRSCIRNLFLDYATHDYLLFLDCDSLVESPDFLKTYSEYIRQHHQKVVCGGRIYEAKRPGREKMLRWKYGLKKESQPVEERSKHPNNSFMTNNFLIHKQVFLEIKFNEQLSEYGHEDTLFGYELKKKQITVVHIDNPIVNGDIEENALYIEKTKKGIANLVLILSFIDDKQAFMNDVSLLRFYSKVEKLASLIRFVFRLSKPLILKTLKSGYINLQLFDFYKLGTLAEFLGYPTIELKEG